MALPSYILITPARNEAGFIELTLESVTQQTVPPRKWVIVSDGSTDGTDDLVRRYVAKFPWIELIRMPQRSERDFAGKVHAFNAGFERLADLNYDVIGNLDADLSFEPDHFEYLVRKFAEDPQLGVVGAPFREGTFQYDYRFTNIENVWGGCQLFRRKCFEDIGGYMPVRGGGIDHIAVVSARMKGWGSRTFTGRVCLHHRQMGTAQSKGLAARFRYGAKDYMLGNDPLWELFRAVYQMKHRPFIIGGFALGAGYFWSMVRRVHRPISCDMVAFIRGEQMQRLRRFLLRKPRTDRNANTAAMISAGGNDTV